jgi:hypothetical protein
MGLEQSLLRSLDRGLCNAKDLPATCLIDASERYFVTVRNKLSIFQFFRSKQVSFRHPPPAAYSKPSQKPTSSYGERALQRRVPSTA